MNPTRTHSPFILQTAPISAEILRADTCDTRRGLARHAVSVSIPNSSFLIPHWTRHPDHLGSSSWITTTNGTVKQHLHYLPWGENFVEQRSTNWHAMYTFSAKEKDAETGYSYFGARYYSSDLSVWLSVDPMADKYPSLSPYVYCANNPIKLKDPDGRKIVFAKGTSKEFKKQFAAAIKNLNEHHLGGIASALEKSKITYTIAETTDRNNSFNSISWNPTMGLEVDEGAILSPTTALNHEFAHALTYDAAVKKGKLNEWYADCAEGSDPDYGSKNEKWVITRTEQKTAKALGEISEGQVTRKKHNGTPVTTENSTSNKKIVNQNDEKIQ